MRHALAIHLACWSSFAAAQSAIVNGFVYNAQSCAGVPRLIVTLTPPVKAQRAEATAVTDESGLFSFARVPQGKYLVTVKYGVQPVYRNVHEVTEKTLLDIRLEAKDG